MDRKSDARWQWAGLFVVALSSARCSGPEHSLGVHEVDAASSLGGARGPGGAPAIGSEPANGPSSFDCEVESLDDDPLYVHTADAGGIPILARAEVDPRAVRIACRGVLFLLSERDDLLTEMVSHDARVVVVAEGSLISEIPELEPLGTEVAEYRSYGAALDRPVTAIAEENILCLPDDPYEGEALLVHAFAHSVRALGIQPTDPGFSAQLETMYDEALDSGLWQDTFAATTPQQYFAEGAQSFFGVNLEASPADGVHGEIDTRAELAEYDPSLFALLDTYFPSEEDYPLCPSSTP